MFTSPRRTSISDRAVNISWSQALSVVSAIAVGTAIGSLSVSHFTASSSSTDDAQSTGGYSTHAVDDTQAATADEHTSGSLSISAFPIGGSVDPIDSPHPLPWSWILDIQNRTPTSSTPHLYYYRSPALISPDGIHAAYSRMQVQRVSNPNHTQVSSLLFLENTETGDLQFLTASSPEMQHILLQGADSQQPGMLSMLIPISWSESGDRVLVRAFESIFSTDIAADYAIIWDQASNHVEHLIPTNAQYSNAVLLGWSQSYPDNVLFRVGNLGDEHWPLMSMDDTAEYRVGAVDRPTIYGKYRTTFWNGPQASAAE